MLPKSWPPLAAVKPLTVTRAPAALIEQNRAGRCKANGKTQRDDGLRGRLLDRLEQRHDAG
jgi:hypothetical protein